MSVGIVEHSILQYVLQYGFDVLQYIAIRFLPYCCTPSILVLVRNVQKPTVACQLKGLGSLTLL